MDRIEMPTDRVDGCAPETDRSTSAARPGLAVPMKRWTLSRAPAALVTVSLFLFMDQIISAEEVHLDQAQPRILETITPQHTDTDIRKNTRIKPRKMNAAVKPPPPPKLSMTKANIIIPARALTGNTPADMDFGRVQPISFDPVLIDDRKAQPITAPLPLYPDAALRAGTEGSCDVRFDVGVRGQPFNISATCTDRVFIRAAERAVSKVAFSPKIVRGTPAERRNVVYPLVFQIET